MNSFKNSYKTDAAKCSEVKMYFLTFADEMADLNIERMVGFITNTLSDLEHGPSGTYIT